MLRSYLAAALRHLARNQLYAWINIIGLAVGFATAILIAVAGKLGSEQWSASASNVAAVHAPTVTLPAPVVVPVAVGVRPAN